MPHADDPPRDASADIVNAHGLVRDALHGARHAEQAALQLLMRHRPECWENAVALLQHPPPDARRALSAACRTYRRIGRNQTAGA